MKNGIVKYFFIALLTISGAVLAAGEHGSSRHSNSGFYLGAGYNFFDTEIGGVEFDNSTVDLRVGTFLTPNFAIEGRFGIGVTDDSMGVTGVASVSSEIDNYYGVYLRGQFPINNQISIYGLLGYANTEWNLSASIPGLAVRGSFDDSDLSWGLGASFALNQSSSVGAEYLSLYDDGGFEVSGFGVNFMHKF